MVDIEAEKTEIRKSLKRIEAAELRKDLEGILAELTDDCMFLVSGGPNIQGRAAWTAFYERLWAVRANITGGGVTSLAIEVAPSGDMAWEHGLMVTEYEGPDGVAATSEGKYLSVYRKVDGKWKTVAVCTAGA